MQTDLRDALQSCVVCSVGPTCSEALAAHNIPVDVEPKHPKMGTLVYEAAQRATVLLAACSTTRCISPQLECKVADTAVP